MSERFDAILVPRGAEAGAVRRAIAGRIPVVECAAGARAADALALIAAGSRVAVLGLCGALDSQLRVGDVVVYERLVNESSLRLDSSSAHVAQHLAARLVAGAGVERVLGSVRAKAELRAASGAEVCDMESASLAAMFASRAIRAITIRVVSDDAMSELPDLSSAYDRDGRLRPMALAAAFVREPLRSARFIVNALSALRALEKAAAQLHSLR
jgi:uridine phosphorylase